MTLDTLSYAPTTSADLDGAAAATSTATLDAPFGTRSNETSDIGTAFSNSESANPVYAGSDFAEFQQSAQIIIAGWYPDPANVDSLRWWDGNAWTANVKARGPVTGPTRVVTHSSATTAFPPVAIRTDAALPPIDPYRPKDKRDHDTYVPMASATTGLTLAPTRRYTTSVWWLATLPVWANLIGVALIVGLGDLFTSFLQLFSSVILFLISIALVVRDRKQLLADNHSRPASALWIVLSPFAYLIARSVHIHRSFRGGWAPTVLFLVSCIVPVAAIVGLSYLQILVLGLSLGF